MSTQLYPEVKDATTLGPSFSQSMYLTIAVEGEMSGTGTASINVPATISRPSDADTLYGVGSPLGTLVKFLLGRGVPFVKAAASASGSTPNLAARQVTWELFESDPDIRVRMTDSTVAADLAALADSCENASLINNKQVGFGGLATPTTSSALTTAAASIASKRFVLVGPGVFDENGVLRDGNFAAACVAAEVMKNNDLGDDMDTLRLAGLAGIEQDAAGMPLFRVKSASGVAVNEFETLLQAGVSPLREARVGGVEITHLRMTYTTDSTFDALMTRLIVDQLFVDVRNYCESSNYLRRGNTAVTRNDLKAGVEALLAERSNWVRPYTQPDGVVGYGVAVQSDSTGRQVTISYKGNVVRGIQTILVDAQLTVGV